MEHSWREKSYCPSPRKRAFQVCKVGRALAFLHGVLHFIAVVVYILHRKVNDIPEFLQVFLHILHFCQIRRTSPGCCRSGSVWLGDAAELGRMRCRSDAGGQGVPRLGSRPEHAGAANTFLCPRFPLLVALCWPAWPSPCRCLALCGWASWIGMIGI